MFSRHDFSCIDEEYFSVLATTGFHVILKSKNTGHAWDIECRQLSDNMESLVIHHKHSEKDPFHIQRKLHPKSLSEAQEMIKKHDNWYLQSKKAGKP